MTFYRIAFYFGELNGSDMQGVNSKPTRNQLLTTRKQQQKETVIEILSDKKEGLSSSEISSLIGARLARTLLLELRNEGKVRQRKGYTMDGRVSYFYVLSKAPRA